MPKCVNVRVVLKGTDSNLCCSASATIPELNYGPDGEHFTRFGGSEIFAFSPYLVHNICCERRVTQRNTILKWMTIQRKCRRDQITAQLLHVHY